MMELRHGWKALTPDYRSPIQGGDPIWGGKTLPYTLPTVTLDTSSEECAAGWNYCSTLADALYIGGLWPTGWPSNGMQAIAGEDAIERKTKRRASSLTLIRVATEQEIADAIRQRSVGFGQYANEMGDQ